MSTFPLSMHAVVIRRFGGPEVVELLQVPVPDPRAGEVLIKVEAASLNPVDYKIRAGKYPLVKDDKLPYILGRDFCGTVVGSDDAALPDGTVVHGLLEIEHGSLAEYTVARTDQLVRVPGTIDRLVAGAVPLAGLTAWQGLFDHGGLQAGQRVLIHAGVGGVGHLAVQFAKARGAEVVTTVSRDNVALAHRFGADEVIDYKGERFEDKVRDVDLVYDLIGGETQERSWSVLRQGGTLVSTVQEPSKEQAAARGVRALRYTAVSNARQLREIDALIESGKVDPMLWRTWAYGQAREALSALEQGHGAGKLMLDMASTIAAMPEPINKLVG